MRGAVARVPAAIVTELEVVSEGVGLLGAVSGAATLALGLAQKSAQP